jgi:hypothetical protein
VHLLDAPGKSSKPQLLQFLSWQPFRVLAQQIINNVVFIIQLLKVKKMLDGMELKLSH